MGCTHFPPPIQFSIPAQSQCLHANLRGCFCSREQCQCTTHSLNWVWQEVAGCFDLLGIEVWIYSTCLSLTCSIPASLSFSLFLSLCVRHCLDLHLGCNFICPCCSRTLTVFSECFVKCMPTKPFITCVCFAF